MNQYEPLKDRIRSTYKIWCAIKMNSVYSYHLSTVPQTNRHASYIRYNFFAMFIIELAKLFVKSYSHHFNLPHLIEDLSSSGEYKELNVSEDFINEGRDLLVKYNLLIQEIRILRDKLFAHTDKQFTVPDLSEDFWIKSMELIAVGFHLLFYLGLNICDIHFDNGEHLADLYGFDDMLK